MPARMGQNMVQDQFEEMFLHGGCCNLGWIVKDTWRQVTTVFITGVNVTYGIRMMIGLLRLHDSKGCATCDAVDKLFFP